MPHDVISTCPVCEGDRLKPEVLAVLIHDASIADVCRLSLHAARGLRARLELAAREPGQRARPMGERHLDVTFPWVLHRGCGHANTSGSSCTGTLSEFAM
jgi:excinuclease ABC subunit A